MTELFTPAVLITEPELVSLEDGMVTYVAEAEVAPFGRVVEAIILPLWPGALIPWSKGDRVLLGIAGGGAGYVLASFQNGPATAAHTQLSPRGESELRLGPPGGEYQPLALFDRMSAEIQELKAQINLIVGVLAGVPGGSTITGFIEARDGPFGPFRGGDPARQAKGRLP